MVFGSEELRAQNEKEKSSKVDIESWVSSKVHLKEAESFFTEVKICKIN